MELHHGRVSLWLEALRPDGASDATPLLWLHALGDSGAALARRREDAWRAWPGAVFALDFSGHGRSGRLRGGGYSPELLAADADAALHAIGRPTWLAGEGLGAWVALLLAGGRPDEVAGAVLWPGPGLAGDGPEPDFSRAWTRRPDAVDASGGALRAEPSTDPCARALLDADARPPDYALELAGAARRLVLVEDGGDRPPWWVAVREVPAARLVRSERPAEVLAIAARLDAVASAGSG